MAIQLIAAGAVRPDSSKIMRTHSLSRELSRGGACTAMMIPAKCGAVAFVGMAAAKAVFVVRACFRCGAVKPNAKCLLRQLMCCSLSICGSLCLFRNLNHSVVIEVCRKF